MLFPDVETSTPFDAQKTRAQTQRELEEGALEAARTLRQATRGSHDADQIRACIAILDRAGYGASAKLTIDDERDYSKLSTDELRQRHAQITAALCMNEDDSREHHIH